MAQVQDAVGERFALERALGHGGMGSVWLARDLRLDRPVALKLLHPHLALDPAACARFLQEARTAARLAHPHIVPVYAVEAHGETAFLVMAVVDGETLGQRVRRRGPLAAPEVERLVREVGWALGYAHSLGVVHRDITPENILIERDTGRALLADFGLAQQAVVEDGAVMQGTPGYVAPEVIRGGDCSPRSDLYALGATAWFALAGAPVHAGDSAGELLAKHLVQPLPPLPATAAGASRRLTDAIRTCLAKDPDARPDGIAHLLSMLDRAAPVVAIAPALQEWFTRWERIRPGYAIVAPVLGLQLWILVAAYFDTGGQALRIAATLSGVVTLAVLPLGGQLIAEMAALRRLASRGFGIADIRTAWDHWTAALREEHARETLPPLAGRVVFDLTVIGFATIAVGLVVAAGILPRILPPSELPSTLFALLKYASWIFLGSSAGLGIGFLAPGVRVKPDGIVRRTAARLWRGPIGGGLARVAAVAASRALPPSSTVHRNTELVLGLAIETLWRALPAEERQPHGDIPGVATTLQHGAEELRSLRDAVLAARDRLEDGHKERGRLDATATDLETRHREAVTRLETLRLQLLRAVSLRTVTSDLREEIVAAREAERALLHGIAGAAETRAAMERRARRDPLLQAPTPTPATP
jgi:serine/threonine-protein kinase